MNAQKTWFITGASRGFGMLIAKAVLASGDKVVATVRSKPNDLINELGNDPSLLVVNMDVTNEEQIRGAVKYAIDNFGQIDVLVNNAGYGLLSAVEEATSEEVRQNYEVNVFGTLNVIRVVLPFMRKARKGLVINISSIGGLTGYHGWGIYGSTKFAIEGITEALAKELAPLGLYATVVAPGFFRTDFLDVSSLVRTKNEIGDYAETVGAMRDFATGANKKQPGDPQKLAEAFVKLGHSDRPPVHLLLGNDTLESYKAKTEALEEDIKKWYDTVTGTDYEDAAALQHK